MNISADDSCELCRQPGGEIVWADELCRVVRVAGREAADTPGLCRVIWNAHVREMTDLTTGERRHLMALVFATETALRRHTRADKINLASFGNVVPHLHWHVIPRYSDDRYFPAPIWAAPRRASAPDRIEVAGAALNQAIMQALAEEQGGGIV